MNTIMNESKCDENKEYDIFLWKIRNLPDLMFGNSRI